MTTQNYDFSPEQLTSSVLGTPFLQLTPDDPPPFNTRYTLPERSRLPCFPDLLKWHGKILISSDLGQDCLEINQGSIVHTNDQADALHLEMPQDKL